MGMDRRRALRAGVMTTVLAGGTAMAGSPAQAAPAGDGWISVLDHDAAGDGLADDTAALNAAFRAATATTPHRSVHFPAGRTFKVSGQVTINGLTDAVVSGQGATLLMSGGPGGSPTGQVSVLRLVGCERVELLGLTIRDLTRAEHQGEQLWLKTFDRKYDGVLLMSCRSILIDGVRVYGTLRNGIVNWDPVPRTSKDLAITNCTVENTWFGISANGEDVRITGNQVAMHWADTDEPARMPGGVRKPELSTYFDGICAWAGAERVVISGNTMTGCGAAGVYLQAVRNVVVAGNTVTDAQERGLEVDGHSVTAGSRDGRAVGVTISGNVVTDSFGGINVVGGYDVTVTGNRVDQSYADRAFGCIAINQYSSSAVVVGNHVRQAHPTWPAVFVFKRDPQKPEEKDVIDVTVAWNTVEAGTPYLTPADTTVIRRSGPGQATIDGKLIARGGIGVGNSLPATSPGTVVRKIEVFTSTGASMGWIPVYNTIS
jgi:parallel beta-helix repeat protein